MAENRAPSTILPDIVVKMAACRVLVVGDIMLDRFVYGDVNRISPESPVPVLTVKNETLMLGGAGNVLSNLQGLGVQADIVSITGNDREAAQLRELVESRCAPVNGLIAMTDRPTTVKTRFLASHQQLLRTDFEKTGDVAPAVEAEILRLIDAKLTGVGAIILSDYGKGALTPDIIAGTIKKARKKNIPVLVDPKRADYKTYKGATIVTPNRKELSLATGGMAVGSDEEVTAAARALMKQSGIESVIATRSQDGMTIIGKNVPSPVHLRTEALEVFDVSGAGDTVIATVAAALAAGASLVEAAGIANVAGGIVVAKVGTTPVRRDELLAALERKEWNGEGNPARAVMTDRTREAPLCRADEAEETVRRWKARGLRVGFTNGCFDILHSGHVSYLNLARSRCDRLIVGLNTDDSVRRLKGHTRPVNDELSRAAVIGALGAIDMVVLFGADKAEDDKPASLIKRLQPDVFFKGGDYTESQLPEAPVVRAYGGEVAIMPLIEGKSTSQTIEKLKEKAA
jgi:D-beta-D-heptose 7-phosphate kinase / D-beta-D-heptose 1-phosphate adenosyltransferase